MKIKRAYPPNYQDILRYLSVAHMPNIVFTHGDTIYVPGGASVSTDLMAHEETHSRQQGKDPDGWWESYLTDPRFRFTQELEAYQNQYKALTQNSREYRRKILRHIIQSLTGDMYGLVITREQAKILVTEPPGEL